MSKIAIHLDHPLIDGEQITFRSPCASADATGLKIYTPTSYEDPTEVSAEYTLKDAGGTTVHGKTGLFATGAYVTVVLDTTNAIAYVHNAKTIYAADLQNNAATTAAGYALDARMGKTLQDQITSLNDSFTQLSNIQNLTVSVANTNLISLAGGYAVGIQISDDYIIAYFSLTFITSANRAANLSVFKLRLANKDLLIRVPYLFPCYLNNDTNLVFATYTQGAQEFFCAPIAWTANTSFRITGVALMRIQS